MRYGKLADQIRTEIDYINRELTRLNEIANSLDRLENTTPTVTKEVISVIDNTGQTEKMALSVREASEMIGISRPKIYELIRKGDFPAFKVGKRTLINKKMLQEWIDSRTED